MFKKARWIRRTDSSVQGNDVKLIKGGHAYFDLLEKMILEAKSLIHFQVYIFSDDETGTRIADALEKAVLRGVQVFLMVDGYASDLSAEFIHGLEEAGVNIRRFEPILKSRKFYFGRRLHHKIVTIDNIYCLVGGLNISNRYNDSLPDAAWLDWALFAKGGIAALVAEICARRVRKMISPIPPTVSNYSIPLDGIHKDCAVRVKIDDWVSRKREITRSYMEMFDRASSHITIMSPYFLPGRELRRRLIMAAKRGVKIKVIQAGVSDILLSKYAERYLYNWLLRNNVEIYEYQRTVLHGKIGICDDRWVTVGSYNLNNLSVYASIELNLEVANMSFAKDVNSQLNEIIKTDCRQITEDIRKADTNWGIYILQKLAYNLLRVILFLFTFYYKQKE